MPPKRKRAEADTTAESSTTRSTKKSSRTTRAKSGANDVTEKATVSNTVEPPPKKTKETSKKNATAAHPTRGRIDDQPLNTRQQQSDNELDVAKQIPSMTPTREDYSSQQAQALFNRFADDDDRDVIGPGGVEKMCTEAGIPLEGAQPLILAWQFKAKEMAKLSRSEWLQGSEALRISSLPVLAIALKELDDLVVHDKEPVTPTPSSSSLRKRDGAGFQEPYNRTRYRQSALNRNAAFADLYQFCFTLSKPPQSRNVDIETATALWSVILAPRHPIVTQLIEFLSESGTYKGANKDIWNMVYEFCRTTNAELTNYEAEGAWPTMLDGFVEWKRKRMVMPAPQDE